MTGSIVSLAKITRPKLALVLHRDRLFKRLDASVQRPIVWIAGPPGSGKTTLMSSYLEARNLAHLWYQLDHNDADVATLFHYMQENAQRHDWIAPQPLPAFSPEFQPDISGFAQRYFRELFARGPRPCALVFDNYQDIPSQSALHNAIAAGLRELSGHTRVFFLSRTAPPAQLSRYRAQQLVEIIEWDDLRLNLEETKAMLEIRKQPLESKVLERLCQETQGWAAGLVLVLEYARTRGLFPGRELEFVPQVIFDYLAGEVFAGFEPRTRTFLMRAACLPRMTVPVAQAVSGEPEAERLLINLSHNNYFVSEKYGHAGREYQFHPLFRKFLDQCSREEWSEQELRDLRRLAARVLLDNGHVDEAFNLFAETSDWESIASVIRGNAPDMLAAGRHETLAYWLDELSPEQLAADPWLLFWYGTAHSHGAPRESRRYFEQASERFRAGEPAADPRGFILSCRGMIDTVLREMDDLALLDPLIEPLALALEQHGGSLSERERTLSLGTVLIALTLRRPGHADLPRWIERTYEIAGPGPAQGGSSSVRLMLVLALLLSGDFARAGEILEAMRQTVETAEPSPLIHIALRVVESLCHMMTGADGPCARSVEEGMSLVAAHRADHWANQLLAHGAGGALAAGNLEDARTVLQRLATSQASGRRLDRCLYNCFCAWLNMLERDFVAAHEFQRLAVTCATEVGMPYLEILCRSGFAQVLFECGDERKGAAQLRKVHALARDLRNPLIEYFTLLGYAYLALKQGRVRSGLNSLRYALGLGREHGYMNALLWQPTVMARLCVSALENDIEIEYVRRMIEVRRLQPEQPPLDVNAWPWRLRAYAFGKFRLVTGENAEPSTAKSQGRPIELFKVLLAFGARDVRADSVAETLWPHVDGDYAYRSFTISLHRLRRLIGDEEAITLVDGRVSLNPRSVWVDTWAFEHAVGRVDALFREPPGTDTRSRVTALADSLVGLYSGAFLADESERPCYISCRDQSRGKFVRAVGKLGRALEDGEDWDAAIDLYERAIERDPIAEGLYRNLMLCHQRRGRPAEAIAAYDRCRNTLAARDLGAPSAELTTVFQSLIGTTR